MEQNKIFNVEAYDFTVGYNTIIWMTSFKRGSSSMRINLAQTQLKYKPICYNATLAYCTFYLFWNDWILIHYIKTCNLNTGIYVCARIARNRDLWVWKAARWQPFKLLFSSYMWRFTFCLFCWTLFGHLQFPVVRYTS